jgi:hypothetical protein
MTITQSILVCGVLAGAVSPATGCDSDPDVAVTRQPLRAECVSDEAALPEGAWLCPDSLTVECDGGDGTTDVEVVYVPPPAEQQCPTDELVVSDSGPFAPGVHIIAVSSADGEALCSTELTVTDSTPPELETHTISLWPPNHKWHAIDVADCVTARDACDGELRAEFIWASSDEPIDDIGDGHHTPDILFDGCETLSVRSERQGPQDGRVYTLGVRVTDSSGNSAEAACQVIVDHDQRGTPAADSG